MYKALTVAVTICLLLAFVLGAVLFSRRGEHGWRDEQLDLVEVEYARNWARLKLLAGCALAGAGLAVVAGAGWGLVAWLNRKAATINPTPAGYPLIVQKLGWPGLRRSLFIFDPNRAPYPATVVTDGPTVQVLQLTAPGVSAEQQARVTSQAQAVQGIAAAVQGGGYRGVVHDVPAALAALPPPRTDTLPPLLEPDGGAVDPLLLAAVEADWREVRVGGE